MRMIRLLWYPLPDSLPTAEPGLFGRLRGAMAASKATAGLSEQELVDRRVRRGAVQALVREAYQLTVAEQDSMHRRPAEFTRAWRAHLASLLGQATVDLRGWGPITIADVDVGLDWTLYEAASHARQHAIDRANAAPSRRVRRGQQVPTFEFAIVSDGDSLGDVTYGICQPCAISMLYKIGFPQDWQFCGLGRLALSQLEARHPDLIWYTTGQFKHARGFYDRYRQDSRSPWTAEQHPCQHFD